MPRAVGAADCDAHVLPRCVRCAKLSVKNQEQNNDTLTESRNPPSNLRADCSKGGDMGCGMVLMYYRPVRVECVSADLPSLHAKSDVHNEGNQKGRNDP